MRGNLPVASAQTDEVVMGERKRGGKPPGAQANLERRPGRNDFG